MNVPPDRQLAILRVGLRAGVPLGLLAQKVGCSARDCDLILWRGLGTGHQPKSAPVTSMRFEHDPRRQAMGREPEPKTPRDDQHLAALRGGFPSLGSDGK